MFRALAIAGLVVQSWACTTPMPSAPVGQPAAAAQSTNNPRGSTAGQGSAAGPSATGVVSTTAAPASAPGAVQASVSEAAWRIPSSAAIAALLAERMEHDGVGVVVGVIEPAGRRVVVHGKSGAANGRPLDGDTIFQIGSVTKVFTALLLADMVQRGEVRIDDPANRYLPAGVAIPVRGRPITLLDLATHRSGLPSMPIFALDGEPDPYAAYSPDQLHAFLTANPPLREPGGPKGYYSNLGVALLGRLLAQRAGIDYEALLRTRILAPLGLTSTAITLTPAQRARLAPGHDRFLAPVDTWNLVTLPASGGLRSTANDLLRLVAAELGYERTPLEAAMLYQRATRQPPTGSQALGWGIGKDSIVKHEGGKEGYRSAVAFDPAARTGAIVLANARTGDSPMDLAMHLLAGKPMPPASVAPALPKQVVLDRVQLDAVTGRYRLASGEIAEIARRGTRLFAQVEGGGVLTFSAEAPLTFFSNTSDDRLTFEADSMGMVAKFTWRGGGETARAERITKRSVHGSRTLRPRRR